MNVGENPTKESTVVTTSGENVNQNEKVSVGENPTKESTIATSSEKVVKQNEKEKMNVDRNPSNESWFLL